MNFTAATFIAIIFLMPGIIFRRFYYSEEFSKEHFKSSLTETLFASVGVSGFLHTIWFYIAWILEYFFNVGGVDLTVIGQLVASKDYPSAAYLNIQQNFFWIALYQVTIGFASFWLGWKSRILVRRKKWDRKYKIFRFKNSWHYIFKGEFTEFPRTSLEFHESLDDIEMVTIDALVEAKENSYLYTGILADYELSHAGGLEYLVLRKVKRSY